MTKKVILLLLSVAFIGLTGTEIYKWVDEEGRIHYSDKPTDKHKAKEVDIEPGPTPEEIKRSQEQVQKMRQRATEFIMREKKREHDEKVKENATLLLKNIKKAEDLEREYGGYWDIEKDLEKQCHEKYEQNCDELLNWKTLAIKQCKEAHGSDQDCGNNEYLLRFKPMTIEEQRIRGVQRRARERRFHNR